MQAFLERAHLQPAAAQDPEVGTRIRFSSWVASESEVNLPHFADDKILRLKEGKRLAQGHPASGGPGI